MANVLNEFLHGVSKGFQDAAFASFSRRRSTVREDIDMHFSTDLEEPEGAEASAAASYLSAINDTPAITEAAPEKPKRATSARKKSSGIVDSSPKSRRGRGKRDTDSGLKNL